MFRRDIMPWADRIHNYFSHVCPFRGDRVAKQCLPISIELGKNIEFRLCVLRQEGIGKPSPSPEATIPTADPGKLWDLRTQKNTLHALQSSFMGTVMFVFISGACGFLALGISAVPDYPSPDAQDLNRLHYLVTRATGEHVRFRRTPDATSSKGMETGRLFFGIRYQNNPLVRFQNAESF
jgi:hypothetical protein